MTIVSTFDKVCHRFVTAKDVLSMCLMSEEAIKQQFLDRLDEMELRLQRLESQSAYNNGASLFRSSTTLQNWKTTQQQTTRGSITAPFVADTTTTLSDTTEPTSPFPTLHCPSEGGYHQVGHTCYAVSFFRALGFEDAAHLCKAQSGGHLAVIETEQELDILNVYLQDHIASNIHPYEHISIWIGGRVSPTNSSEWFWLPTIYNNDSFEQVSISPNLARCETSYFESGAENQSNGDEVMCISLVWNANRGCQFSLERAHCGRSFRYICEADPL